MTTTNKAPFQLGSISTGTLRPEDLLEAFTPIMQKFLTDNGHEALYVNEAEALLELDLWYERQLSEASQLVGVLTDGIQGYCPPFVYFGAHPGDGADFGFWVDMEDLEEAMRNYDMVEGGVILEDDGVIIQVSDHGNITCLDMDRNELWSVV